MGNANDLKIIRQHVDWLRRTGATPVTQRYRMGTLRRLSQALPAGLLDATGDDLDRWQSDLTVSLSTLAGYTSHVRQFYKWAVVTGRIVADPTTRLPKTKVPKRRPRPVPDEDLRIAITCASEPIRIWLILAAFMGLRAMEIAGMKRDDIVQVDGRYYLDGVGKGAKPFRLPIPEHVVPVLVPHLSGRTGPLWRTAPGGRASRPADVSEQVVKFFRALGMPYSLHQCRHSFGTSLYRQTRDLLTTQDAMRHSNPTTTRGYVETTAPAATAAMDRLSAAIEDRRRRSGRRSAARTAEVTRRRARASGERGVPRPTGEQGGAPLHLCTPAERKPARRDDGQRSQRAPRIALSFHRSATRAYLAGTGDSGFQPPWRAAMPSGSPRLSASVRPPARRECAV